ncbi:hypothetical protein [Streptomyces sannanensis]|uniref:hypothetical protein n=1 Tax=Streptomyces sannanensis TaxID=285536 RepID=UPI0031EC0B8C
MAAAAPASATDIVFDATAGQQSYLWTRNVPVTSDQKADDRLAVHCRYADGTALPAGEEAGAYVRWMFTAPTTGSYRCRVSAGTELARKVYSGSARWTLPATGRQVVAAGGTATTLEHVYTPSGAHRIAIVLDARLTGASMAHTWIEAQPQTSAGAPCGGPFNSPLAKWTRDRQHRGAMNTLYLDTSLLGGCPRLLLSLKIQNVSDTPLTVLGGHPSGGIAATHGIAFTY